MQLPLVHSMNYVISIMSLHFTVLNTLLTGLCCFVKLKVFTSLCWINRTVTVSWPEGMIKYCASMISANQKQVCEVTFWICFDFQNPIPSHNCLKIKWHVRLNGICNADPQELAGHTSAIKKALWCNNDQQILSAADDKTVRWVSRMITESLCILQ